MRVRALPQPPAFSIPDPPLPLCASSQVYKFQESFGDDDDGDFVGVFADPRPGERGSLRARAYVMALQRCLWLLSL